MASKAMQAKVDQLSNYLSMDDFNDYTEFGEFLCAFYDSKVKISTDLRKNMCLEIEKMLANYKQNTEFVSEEHKETITTLVWKKKSKK